MYTMVSCIVVALLWTTFVMAPSGLSESKTSMNSQTNTPPSVETNTPTRLETNSPSNNTVTLHLGVLLPLSGESFVTMTTLGAMTVAIDHIMSNPGFQNLFDAGIQFDFDWKNTHGVIGKGLTAIIELWVEAHSTSLDKLSAFIGRCMCLLAYINAYLTGLRPLAATGSD